MIHKKTSRVAWPEFYSSGADCISIRGGGRIFFYKGQNHALNENSAPLELFHQRQKHTIFNFILGILYTSEWTQFYFKLKIDPFFFIGCNKILIPPIECLVYNT